jgi:hypothetical protein
MHTLHTAHTCRFTKLRLRTRSAVQCTNNIHSNSLILGFNQLILRKEYDSNLDSRKQNLI